MRLYLCSVLLLLNIYAFGAQEKSVAKDCMLRALEYFEHDNFPEAMRCFTRSMELADSLGDEHTWLVSVGYISNVYYNAGDYGRALYYQTRGYETACASGETRMQKSYLSNMVAACCKSGRLALAKKYIKQLDRLFDKNSDSVSRYYYMYNTARILTVEGRYDEAIKRHLETLDFARRNGMSPEYRLFQYCEIGNVYLLKGEYAKAVEWGQKCLDPKVGEKPRDFLTSVYNLLADAYMMSGDKKLGEYFNGKYFVMQDSVFNRSRLYSAGNNLMEYENRKTSQKINSLNGTISRQFLVMVVFGVLLLALAAVSVLLLRNNRRLNMAYRLLIRKEKDMDKQERRTKKLLEDSVRHNSPATVTETAVIDAESTGEAPVYEKDGETDTADKDKNGSGISMSEENRNRLLNSVIDVMNDIGYISKPDFSLQALAEAVSSNTRYVSWVINDTYGKNFKTLLNECRIREACRRLLDAEHYGNLTIQAIYEDVGYTNSVSFIRAFKKVNGMTPSEYQRQYRMEETGDK